MRELLESEDWVSAKAELPIALGRDVSGKPLISDLAKMPHLMIAGATGSGKSVCINSIVTSILYSKSPRDVRLIMVDPKVVELKVFNSLPHMFIPVVTEPKKVPAALKWLLGEMEQRYQIFAKANVRNIVGFNTRKKDAKQPAEAQSALHGIDAMGDTLEIPDHLPYIVAIIDELADLMILAPAEIETSIARLAQLARAAGIHLIIATQRPSVERHHRRHQGQPALADRLPGRLPGGFAHDPRHEGRGDADRARRHALLAAGHLPARARPGRLRRRRRDPRDRRVPQAQRPAAATRRPCSSRSTEASSEDDEEVEDDGDLGSDEELYTKALDVLKSTRRASTSMLQRRLRIGYNRAARIMEIMEEKGIVGPENGSSPREILGDLDAM